MSTTISTARNNPTPAAHNNATPAAASPSTPAAKPLFPSAQAARDAANTAARKLGGMEWISRATPLNLAVVAQLDDLISQFVAYEMRSRATELLTKLTTSDEPLTVSFDTRVDASALLAKHRGWGRAITTEEYALFCELVRSLGAVLSTNGIKVETKASVDDAGRPSSIALKVHVTRHPVLDGLNQLRNPGALDALQNTPGFVEAKSYLSKAVDAAVSNALQKLEAHIAASEDPARDLLHMKELKIKAHLTAPLGERGSAERLVEVMAGALTVVKELGEAGYASPRLSVEPWMGGGPHFVLKVSAAVPLKS